MTRIKTAIIFSLILITCRSEAAWNQFQKNARHTGYECEVNFEGPLCIKWRTQMAAGTRDSSVPAVSDDGVLYIDSGNVLSAHYIHTGTLLWRNTNTGISPGDSVTFASPVLYDGKVVLNKDLMVRAYSMSNGMPVWTSNKTNVSDIYLSKATLKDDRLYIGTSTGKIFVHDAKNGNTVTVISAGANAIYAPPSVDDDGDIYVGDEAGTVYGIDGATGTVKWNRTVTGSVLAAAAVDDTGIYFGTGTGFVYCLNKADGSIKWQRFAGGVIYGSGALDNENFYIGSNDRSLYCHKKSNGARNWKTTFNDNFIVMSCVITCRKLIILGCKSGAIVVNLDDPGTGAMICYSKDSNRTAPAIWKGMFAFTSKDHYLYVMGKCPDPCGPCYCDARITVVPTPPNMPTYTSTHTPSVTRTHTPTSTFTKTQTTTSSRTFTATGTFTQTATNSFTGTFTATFSATHTPSSTGTYTFTATRTPTATLTDTATPDPCATKLPAQFSVKMIFNPESTGDIIFEITSTKPLSGPPTADIFPHGGSGTDKKLPLLFRSEQVPGETLKYRVIYPRRTGFGDIDRVVIKGTDICGLSAESDGTFEKSVISQRDVTVYKNIIEPEKHERCIIRYKIYAGGPLVIKIFNRNGSAIKTLKDETVTEPGEYEVAWDGDDDSGKTVAAGIYHAVVETAYYKVLEKIGVLK